MVTPTRAAAELLPVDALPLTAVAPGCVARIAEIADDGQDSARLKALGLCSGRSVQVAAAGDPLIVQVVGTRVGVSARLAQQVTVVPEPPAASQ